MPPEDVFAWLEVLDELTYYELFGVSAAASVDEIRTAFHAFCDVFHPDRHVDRPEDERSAIFSIFTRGTEGYLVLCDVGFRERYDRQISADRTGRRLVLSPHSRSPASVTRGPARLEDAVRSPSARPFARRAEELIQKGELRQAKLQLVMANHKEPANAELEAALRDLEARILGHADPPK